MEAFMSAMMDNTPMQGQYVAPTEVAAEDNRETIPTSALGTPPKLDIPAPPIDGYDISQPPKDEVVAPPKVTPEDNFMSAIANIGTDLFSKVGDIDLPNGSKVDLGSEVGYDKDNFTPTYQPINQTDDLGYSPKPTGVDAISIFDGDTNATDYPEHLLKAELGTDAKRRDRKAVKLHGAHLNTIGYGLDLKYDPNNYKYLKKAGVSDANITKLKSRDITARITIDQATKASAMAYKAKYKQISHRLKRHDISIDKMSPLMRSMVVSLGYNGYLSSLKQTKNKYKKNLYAFRSKIWDYVKSNDDYGLLSYIKNSNFRKGVVRRRFERAGFL